MASCGKSRHLTAGMFLPTVESARLILAEEAEYRTRHHYDSLGRLTQVTGGEESLGFEYDGRGLLKRVAVDGTVTWLHHEDSGELRHIEGSAMPRIEYHYSPSGRVEQLIHGDSSPARYAYNRQGFRKEAMYPSGAEVRLRYDASGNLIETERTLSSGDGIRKSYELGAFNEVLRIDNHGQASPDLELAYDRSGRLVRAIQGDRVLRVWHDPLGRLGRVTLDGEVLLEPEYGLLVEDVVAAQDQRTGEVWMPAGTSAVFGDRLSVEATRLRSTEYGPIAYDPLLRAFVIRPLALSEMSLLLSGLDRRRVPYRGKPASRRPLRHDAPSNSLFIPPEFRSINCDVCADTATAYIRANSARNSCGISGVAGMELNVECQEEDSPDGTPSPSPQWWHHVDFGDEGLWHQETGGRETHFFHRYFSEGTYQLNYSAKLIDDPCLCPTSSPIMDFTARIEMTIPERVPSFEVDLDPSGNSAGRFYISNGIPPRMPSRLIRASVSSNVPGCVWVDYQSLVSVKHEGNPPYGQDTDGDGLAGPFRTFFSTTNWGQWSGPQTGAAW